MSCQAAIFDMDGTLIDSTWALKKVDEKFYRKLGIIPKTNLFKDLMHMPQIEAAKFIKETNDLDLSVEEIAADMFKLAIKYYEEEVVLKPGVLELLQKIKDFGIKICLATGCPAKISEIVLKRLGIYDFFDCLLFCEELGVNKSTAKIYLIGAEKLEVKPENCIVFEDIAKPMRSVLASGMKFVGVSDSNQPDEIEEDLKLNASHFIKNYESFIISSFFKENFKKI